MAYTNGGPGSTPKNLADEFADALTGGNKSKLTDVGRLSAIEKGGTKSYKSSYTPEVEAKWKSKGGYDAYEKAAKAWNQKKYGTTEPTAKAKSAGLSKSELAKEHTASSQQVAASPTTSPESQSKYTSVNKPHVRMEQTVTSAQDPQHSLIASKESRLDRKISRLQDRKARREGRRSERLTGIDSQATPKLGRMSEVGGKKGYMTTSPDGKTPAYVAKGNLGYERMMKIKGTTSNRSGESASQERKNLLTDNPVDNRAATNLKGKYDAGKHKAKRTKIEAKQDKGIEKGDERHAKREKRQKIKDMAKKEGISRSEVRRFRNV